MSYTILVKKEVPVTTLKCDIGVRYWEDGVVDGVEDENGREWRKGLLRNIIGYKR